jgi:anthranilate synthase component 1
VELSGFEAPGETRTEEHPSPLDRLAELMRDYRTVHPPDLPRFCGGAVGYLAYDVVRQIERLPNPPARSLGLPEIYFGLYRSMLVFDHVNRTLKVVAHADMRRDDPDTAYDKAVAEIDRLTDLLRSPGKLPVESVPVLPAEDPAFESNFAQADFEAAVEACKEYIRAGDIFQVVLSQRLKMRSTADPFAIYRTLRTINPSPYMFYLRYPELTLVGSSPEVMVRVEDDRITLRPIAGTRRRGQSAEEDEALARDLLADEKERAEHTMLVDLGRNDVGRVSAYGTVALTEKMVIENYSHVMHIVSNVEGRLREGLSAFDALKASLPAGTVSGAPKVRAMEIIDELEPDVRGPYAGAVGYFDFSGNMDTCITIRTICVVDESAYVQAGAGIVLDSVPEREYHETRSKARALLRAIRAAQPEG